MKYVGIDLGTTNSAICSFDGESIRLYKSPEQHDVTPSAIFIDRRGNKYVGSRAYNNAARNPDNAAVLFKRLMGTSTPVKLPAVNLTMTPEECSAEVLRALYGYLPEEMQRIIAAQLGIPVSRVYGVVTFYTFFTMLPKGKHPISVCMGTACYVRGSEKLLEEFKRVLGIEVGETTPDGKFSLDCLRCVGACGLAPVVMIGEKVYGRLQPIDVKKILEELE